MHITDPIADMLTRIRNANNAKHDTVDVPASNMKKAIAQILLEEGYIKNFQLIDDGTQGVIRITYEPHKSEPGAFNKVIQVYSNSVDGRDVITVQGNSIEGQPRGKVKTEKVKVKYK